MRLLSVRFSVSALSRSFSSKDSDKRKVSVCVETFVFEAPMSFPMGFILLGLSDFYVNTLYSD